MAAEERKMSFLDHIDELRGHLFRSVIAVVAISIVAFSYKNILFDKIILAAKYPNFWTYRMACKLSHFLHIGDKLCLGNDLHFRLISTKLTGQFMTHMIVAFVAGIIIAFPYILFEFWRFLKPALKKRERKAIKKFVFWGSILFFIGVLFGYYIIAPLTVEFLGDYQVSSSVVNYISLSSYISTVTMVILSAGIIFELPLLVYFLAKMGIVTAGLMKRYRRHSIVAILILAAIITPPNVASQVLVAIPLQALYEISIVIAKRVDKKRQAAGA